MTTITSLRNVHFFLMSHKTIFYQINYCVKYNKKKRNLYGKKYLNNSVRGFFKK